MFAHFTPKTRTYFNACFKSRLYSSNVNKAKKGKWKSVVGLEIHAQINTNSKLFSGASTRFGSPANSNVSFFDAAIPGTLPVLNKGCVESAILTALALSCRVNEVSEFDRKHYFYADLPSGYQITQQRAPLANFGTINFDVFTPGVHKSLYQKTSKLKQLQLEQDSGKSLHDEETQKSLIDLNRAGIPLMELVFEPDLSDGEEAAALVKELCLILNRLNTCTCKMEEGALRVDANISVNKDSDDLGTRTEVKNIGSIRGVANAVSYEIDRQIQILENGGEVINETRAWNAITSETVPMRDKEVKQTTGLDVTGAETAGFYFWQDYRFMPEPNLPPLRLNVSNQEISGVINVQRIKDSLPELPQETRKNLQDNYGLSREMILHLVNNEILFDLFTRLKDENNERDSKQIAKFITIELMNFVNRGEISLEDHRRIYSLGLGEIIDMLQSGDINLASGKIVLNEKINGNPNNPKKIVESGDMLQINDEPTLKRLCSEAIENNAKAVRQYRQGKTKVFPSFLGYIAKKTDNKVNMGKIVKLLGEMLESK